MNMKCTAVQCSVRTGCPSQQCVFVVEPLTAGFLAFLVLCKQGLSPKGSATNSCITHCTSHQARAPHFVWGGMWQFNGQKRKSKRSVFCTYFSLDLSCRRDVGVTALCQDQAGKLRLGENKLHELRGVQLFFLYSAKFVNFSAKC